VLNPSTESTPSHDATAHQPARHRSNRHPRTRALRGKGSRYTKNAPSKRATWLKHNSPSLRRYR